MSHPSDHQSPRRSRTSGISRRRFVQAGAGAALASGLIVPSGVGAAPGPRITFPSSRLQEEPKRGGVLRYGLSTDPSNFEPHVSTGAASSTVKVMVYAQLLTYDNEANLIGNLAEEFGWADDT